MTSGIGPAGHAYVGRPLDPIAKDPPLALHYQPATRDAELLAEVIDLCVQYNNSRSFSVSMTVSKAGAAALDRAKLILGFMVMPNEFRRYYESVEQAGAADLLTAANGFRPHNDACSAKLRADLERLLMPAILVERNR